MQETRVWSLGQEDPLEKGMATHSSIPAWRIPWPEEPAELLPMVLQRVGHDWATKHIHTLGTFKEGHAKIPMYIYRKWNSVTANGFPTAIDQNML